MAKRRYLVTGLPIIYYTPETRFAYGLTGICIFNFKNDTLFAPRSNLALTFVYTQNKQILLSLPFNLFIKNREYQVYGEITYNRFNYDFFGVGNEEPKSYVERYGIEFPRLRLTALKKVRKYFYAGLRYAYDNYRLYDFDESGKLITGLIPGSAGGTVSGFGAVFLWDSRDNVFFPSKGIWSELVVFRDDKRTGSTFNYTRVALDFAKYFSYRNNILALNFYSVYSSSDLPFFQMGNLGGLKKMRGFYEGRYRDNNLILFQAEFRRMVYGPFGIAVFADIGQVANRYNRFNSNYWRYTYGAGLRLRVDKQQKMNLRFDVAVGDGSVLPYFTIGEAF